MARSGTGSGPAGSPAWHLITGTYPPQLGGVADYSRLVAGGLAKAGQEVHVWTSDNGEPAPDVPGVTLHRIAGAWRAADLARLSSELDAYPGPRRLLVQYVSNAYGRKGLNLGFCRWLGQRRDAGDDVWSVIHEAFYMPRLIDRPTRYVRAIVHRLMMRRLLRASRRVFVSIPVFIRQVQPYAPEPAPPIAWQPIPSTIPVDDDAGAVAAIRQRLAPRGEAIIGTFGVFGPASSPLLRSTWPAILAGEPGRIGLLLGRGSEAVAAELVRRNPELAGRIVGVGELGPGAASAHVQACDVMLQLYEDGATSRRTSLMTSLAHGRAVVTNPGHNSEPLWAESGAVALAAAPQVPVAVGTLLADPSRREALGTAARALYDRRFALERTIEALLTAADDDWSDDIPAPNATHVAAAAEEKAR